MKCFNNLILLLAAVLFGSIAPETSKIVMQDAPPKRAHHDMVYNDSCGCILLSGGSSPVNGGQSFVFYNDLWRYDGKMWKHSGNSGNERSGIRLAYDSKQKKVFSYGGFANNQPLGDLRVLENGEWKTLTDVSEMKAAEGGFVYDSDRNRLVAFGGANVRGIENNSVWEWDGTAWNKMSGSGPGSRQAFAMVYDEKRRRTVIYGGMDTNGKQLSDTWEWDGIQWTMATGSGPGPRVSPGYAYDSKGGFMILFGGMQNSSFKNDTWSWDGSAWKLLSDKGPSPRTMGCMAYDKKRDRIVMFGGRLGWPNDVNDTWEWNGSEWYEVR
ncbi:MAG TPA: hypothetical protein VGD17_02040 [Chitinophagaceae bacterium]